RPGVPIRLEHPEVALVHAALVHIDGHAAVFDLTSASGTWVDGKRVSLALLRGGERLRIGPIELRVKEQAADGVFGEQSELEFASGAGVRIGQLLKLQEELRIRTRQIDQREEHLESEQALLEKSRSSVERDRRALQQQAMALWKARTQFDVERSLHSGAGSATVGGSLSLPAPPIIEAANSSELAQDQPPRVLRVAEPGGLGWTDPRRPA
ncbi:MAG: FHA domain-containing protein, partial [bacterium]|nr:FHA domain-containing protein [bacterium]